MPFIEFRQRLYRLKKAGIRLSELDRGYRIAISVEDFGSFAWAVQDAGPVAINDSPLKRDPVALFNGDRLSLNGCTIVFIDDGGGL